jgi:hypothetical protein
VGDAFIVLYPTPNKQIIWSWKYYMAFSNRVKYERKNKNIFNWSVSGYIILSYELIYNKKVKKIKNNVS